MWSHVNTKSREKIQYIVQQTYGVARREVISVS